MAGDIDINVNLRSPIATIIDGLGHAIGGIGNAIGGATKLVANSVKSIGDVAASSKPAQTVNQSNLGLIAAAAQENVKPTVTGGGTLPPRKSAPRVNPSAKMSTEKLLSVVVTYLSSIDSSLKAQMDYNVQASREEAAQQKEAAIENESRNSIFTRLANRMKMRADAVANKAKDTGIGFAKSAAMIAAAAVAMKLSTLKTDEIEKLKKTIGDFERTWGGAFQLIGGLWLGYKTYGAANWLWQLFNKDKSLAGWAVEVSKKLGLRAWTTALELAGGSAAVVGAAAVGAGTAVAAQLALVDWIIKDAHKAPDEALVKLQKEYGLQRVEDGWQIKGKFYRNENVPERYRDIIDVAFGLRGGSTEKSLARIQANPRDYTRDVLEKEYLPNVDQNGVYKKPDATKQTGAGAIPDSAYNVAWNNGRDLAPPKPLSEMTVKEVLDYQTKLFQAGKQKNGVGHTGVGAFAIQKAGLEEAVQKGAIGLNDRFDRVGQEKVGTYIWNSRRGMSMGKTWVYTGQHPEKGYWDNQTFEQNKYNIALNEVGPYAGMTGSTPIAQGVGATAEALGTLRMALLDAVSQKSTFSAELSPDVIAKNNTAQTAAKIQEQAIAVENEMRGSAKKEADRVAAINRMSPGAKLAAANGGKLEALDPNYKVDPNNIITKYFVHFGLAA